MKRLLKLIPYKSIPVLLYHRIAATTPKEDPLRLAVPPEVFEAQMEYLRSRGFSLISLEDIVNQTGQEKNGRAKRIAITFDDGYLDNYRNAFPILHKYGFPATIFLITDLLGKNCSWDGKNRVPLLDWPQIKEMMKYRISFQSHTCTHPDLTKTAEGAILRELFCSKRKIEDALGFPAEFLAYPSGNYNQNIIQLTEQAGYQSAFAAGLSEGGKFTRERFQVTCRDPIFQFRLATSEWGSWIRKVRHLFLKRYQNKYRLTYSSGMKKASWIQGTRK